MNKSNPRTVLKKIVLLSYTLSMIVFSCIVIGFSKDLAIIYCSAFLHVISNPNTHFIVYRRQKQQLFIVYRR